MLWVAWGGGYPFMITDSVWFYILFVPTDRDQLIWIELSAGFKGPWL